MTKRDTFRKNIFKLTQSRSLKKATQDWSVKRRIDQKGLSVTCELCGTRFNQGAVVVRRATGRPVTITVGGDCLTVILTGRFANRKFIPARQKQVSDAIAKTYGDVIDPGSWINWIIANAPARLAPLVTDLQFLKLVPNDRDLQKLIVFHDKTRRYPREALLPEWQVFDAERGLIPDHITLDEARRFLAGLDEDQQAAYFVRQSDDYVAESLLPAIQEDKQTLDVWKKLGANSKRSLSALCRLTDRQEDGDELNLDRITAGLLPITFPLKLPVFLWHPVHGVGIAEDPDGDETQKFGGKAQFWLWKDGTTSKTDLAYWRTIQPKSDDDLRDAECLAFWNSPTWCKQDPFATKRNRSSRPSKSTGRGQAAAERAGALRAQRRDEAELFSHRPMQDLLAVARFRLGRNPLPQACIDWVRTRLDSRKVTWTDWLWMLDQYSHDPDVRTRVDALVQDIGKG
jgi:hypothetical protein